MAEPHRGSRKTVDVLARAAIIYSVLAQEGEATRAELVARVRDALGTSAYGAAPEDALRHDLNMLALLGFEVAVMRGHRYQLTYREPLFPLPLRPEHIETLAAVRRALEKTLYGETVEDLIRRLRPFIAPSLRPLLDREPVLKLNTPLIDDLAPHHITLNKLRRAQEQQLRFSFLYRSPLQPDSRPVRHTIEPETIEERAGHVYFEGYSVDTEQILQFRLDRVELGSAEVLPSKFPGQRERRPISICYRLSPSIARYGASRRFDQHAETVLPDGWVEVRAETKDLFWASKILLKYGENCIAVEPPELVAELKRVVWEMARNYGIK